MIGEADGFGAELVAALAASDLERFSELTRRTPLHALMGLHVARMDADTTVMTMEMSDAVRGATPGTIHGGMLATFADVVSAVSLSRSYDLEKELTVTTDMHVRYYRQPKSGPLTAEARVVHRGRRLLSTECAITDAEERVLARSTATYMLVPAPY